MGTFPFDPSAPVSSKVDVHDALDTFVALSDIDCTLLTQLDCAADGTAAVMLDPPATIDYGDLDYPTMSPVAPTSTCFGELDYEYLMDVSDM